MKKLIVGLFILGLTIDVASAFVQLPTEEAIYVREEWNGVARSYAIEEDTAKLGYLYRNINDKKLSYSLYGMKSGRYVTAEVIPTPRGLNIEMTNYSNHYIGRLEEKIFDSGAPSFELLDSDNSYKIAHGELNFWGTKIVVYDTQLKQEMGTMSRPFFRKNDNWTIKLVNDFHIFANMRIDSSLLIMALALQSELEYWKEANYHGTSFKATEPAVEDLSQVRALMKAQGFVSQEPLNKERLEILADQLDQEFNALHPRQDNLDQPYQKRSQDFINFCLAKVQSKDTTAAQKNDILELLSLRLQLVNH